MSDGDWRQSGTKALPVTNLGLAKPSAVFSSTLIGYWSAVDEGINLLHPKRQVQLGRNEFLRRAALARNRSVLATLLVYVLLAQAQPSSPASASGSRFISFKGIDQADA